MHKRIWLTLVSFIVVVSSLVAINIKLKKLHKTAKIITSSNAIDSLKDGDLIFQTSIEGQGLAIQLATKSTFTHVGVIFKVDGKWMVYEAVQPVRKVTLESFIHQGDSEKYVIKRLVKADSSLTMDNLAHIRTYLNTQLNKNYDPYFNWKDDALYCSELVWKCYRKVGLELSPLNALKSYDLSNAVVKKILKQRYGNKIPLEEKVVSPGDIFNSKLLFEVRRR